MQNYPKISIVILNWNGWKDTVECLTSVRQIEYPNYCMVVIDNGSTDDSIRRIKEWASGNIKVDSKFLNYHNDAKLQKIVVYEQAAAVSGGFPEEEEKLKNIPSPLKLVIIKCSENLGFAKGNNVGLCYSLKNNFDYIWLLNNDTIVDKKALINLLEPFEKERQIGMTGSKICYYGEPERVWFAGAKINWLCGESFHFKKKDGLKEQLKCNLNVERLTGCSMLVSAELCRNVGLFDENFYLYVEEIDWCLRALRNGYKIAYVPNSIVYHKISREKNNSSDYTAFYCYYQTRNFLYLIRKHIKAPKKFLYLGVALSYKLMLVVKNFLEVKFMQKKSISYPYIIKGIRDFFNKNYGKREI